MPTTSRVLGTHQALEEKRRRDLRAVDQCRYTLLKGREYRDSNGRNIQLEDLYLVDTPHPLRLNAPGGKTFIYYADTTVEGCQKTYDQELTLKVPNGSYTDIVAKGYLELRDRDAVFSRSLQGSQDPLEDVIQVWVTDGRIYTAEQKERVAKARDIMLGPRNTRGRYRPRDVLDDEKRPTGEKVGGTAYERSSVAVSVKYPARAYTISLSVEAPTAIMAPVASTRISEKYDVEDRLQLDARNQLLRVSSEAAMAAACEGPVQWQRMVKAHSSLTNKPATGCPENWAYGTVQINIAPAIRQKDIGTERGSLGREIGEFGLDHFDEGDDVGPVTHMASYQNVPDGYLPGMFFVLQLGVFVCLEEYRGINFSGRRKHGGTAPVCPTDHPMDLRSWAIRFVGIHYPPARIFSASVRASLAALPNNEAFFMAPEMVNTGRDGWSPLASTRRSTFIREGVSIMDARSLLAFVVRNLVLFCVYVLAQLPAAWKIRLDPDAFTRAITFEEDGRRVNTGRWDLAPGHRRADTGAWEYESSSGNTVALEPARVDAFAAWDKFQQEVAMHIPSVGRNGGITYHLPNPELKQKKKKEDKAASGSESDSNDGAVDDQHTDDGGKKKKKKKRKKKPVVPPREESDPGVPDSANESEDLGCGPPDIGDLGGEQAEVQNEEQPLSKIQLGKRKAGSDDQRPSRDDGVHRSLALGSLRDAPKSRLVTRRSSRFGAESQAFNPSLVHPVDEGGDAIMEDANSIGARLAAARRREGSAVMQLLTFEHIDSNLGEVEYSCLTLANHASADIDMWEVRHKLKQVEMAVFRAPNSDETPAYIAQIWTNVASLQGEEALSAVQQRQRRAGIMSTNYWAWRWLDGYCTQLIEKAFHNPAPDICQASWITRLAKDVRNALENRMNTRIFDPAVYSTSISGDTFTYECSRPPYLADSGPELLQQTLVLTTTIIAQWLEFPVNSPARQQAWFVHALFITVGDQALLLDEVWLAHSDLRKYVLGNAKQKEEVVACFEHLRDALREHPLAQDGSQERQMLSAMSSLINNACNGSLKYTPLVDSFEFASAETPPAPEELEELDIEAEEPESEEDVGRSTQGLLGVAAEKILQRFIDFLTESAAAALDDLPSPNTFQTELLRRMDYICPFRELAPSRLRAAGPEGPFTPALCRTDEGMYSALLYRGVTFGTEFQMQYPMVYEDAAEFHDCNERASEEYWEENDRAPEPSFFCKSDAFGPPNWRRNISLVDTYYTQIRQFGWAQQFESRDQIPFLECWEFVPEPEHFPVLGPLAGYLLTADMSYTGAVIPPTIDDIATVIWDMNKGAAKALEILQLIPARKVSVAGTVSKADKHTVRKAVRSLYKRLETMLPAQLRRSVGFDPIVLEHALCKFSRCIAKKWFFLHPNKRAGGKRKGNARARRQAVKPN